MEQTYQRATKEKAYNLWKWDFYGAFEILFEVVNQICKAIYHDNLMQDQSIFQKLWMKILEIQTI